MGYLLWLLAFWSFEFACPRGMPACVHRQPGYRQTDGLIVLQTSDFPLPSVFGGVNLGKIHLTNPLNLGNLRLILFLSRKLMNYQKSVLIRDLKKHQFGETKPILGAIKMNATYYVTSRYDNISPLLKMQKQSQTNPIQSQSNPIQTHFKPKTKPNQTQTNPIFIPAGPPGYRVPSFPSARIPVIIYYYLNLLRLGCFKLCSN